MAETKEVTNKKKLEEVTTGLETIVGDKPVVEIEGKEYQLRRLGIQDTFKVIRIIGIGISQMAGMFPSARLDVETAGLAFIAAIPYSEKEILDLLASLINVEPEEIRDPEMFPLGSEITIIEALTKHQDMKAFFTQLQRLTDQNPAVKRAMQQATAQEEQSKEQ